MESYEGDRKEGYLPGYILIPEELQLKEFCRDWVHANSGNHLRGVITDDGVWQG